MPSNSCCCDYYAGILSTFLNHCNSIEVLQIKTTRIQSSNKLQKPGETKTTVVQPYHQRQQCVYVFNDVSALVIYLMYWPGLLYCWWCNIIKSLYYGTRLLIKLRRHLNGTISHLYCMALLVSVIISFIWFSYAKNVPAKILSQYDNMEEDILHKVLPRRYTDTSAKIDLLTEINCNVWLIEYVLWHRRYDLHYPRNRIACLSWI